MNNLNAEQLKVLEDSKKIISEIKKVIIGKDEIIVKILLAIYANGHILIEDIPGVGKTTLALALSKALSLHQNRLQFTPDVLPTDVTGFSIYNNANGEFEYKAGAIMCNLFLADEINRTSSKTQSALLEVMEEGKVTVDNVTRLTPKPFTVIATQNPMGSSGTQALPDSQLDRFVMRISMGYPDIDSEINILKSKNSKNPLDDVVSVVSGQDIINTQKVVEKVFISDEVYRYIAEIVLATRNHPLIKLGVSPRGTIAITKISKATALLKGRDYVLPDDISFSLNDVICHRLILNAKAKLNNATVSDIVSDILKKIPAPRISR